MKQYAEGEQVGCAVQGDDVHRKGGKLATPCPECQGSGWRKPVEDKRNIFQRMTFVRCEKCVNGHLPEGLKAKKKE